MLMNICYFLETSELILKNAKMSTASPPPPSHFFFFFFLGKFWVHDCRMCLHSHWHKKKEKKRKRTDHRRRMYNHTSQEELEFKRQCYKNMHQTQLIISVSKTNLLNLQSAPEYMFSDKNCKWKQKKQNKTKKKTKSKDKNRTNTTI